MSDLWQSITQSNARTIAFLGMTKNTGKTVALNHVLAQAAKADCPMGISSIGRDGEELDQVFQVPKPPIRVWPGSIVATARATLERSRARTRLLQGTGIASPMGEIMLVQVLAQGEMEIAGASRGSDQVLVIGMLRRCGARRVALDGALGRSQHASPSLADGVIVSTGAAIGGAMDDVLRKTRERVALLRIPPAPEITRTRCAEVFERGGVGVWGTSGHKVFGAPIATLNAAESMERFMSLPVTLIAVNGAVGRSLWRVLQALAQGQPGLELVVADGTKLFVDAADIGQYRRAGGRLYAYRPIHLLGLTVNPFSPYGGSFEPERFLNAARREHPELSVCDVMLQQQEVIA
jgi:hypothetical protein